MTELLFLNDAYQRTCEATVKAVEAAEGGSSEGARASVVLDRTIFYYTGGGQPHDTGTISVGGLSFPVTEVRRRDGAIWHTVDVGDSTPPAVGDVVGCELDWNRRHDLMRTHTALHILCGVIWNEWGKSVTGGNMDRLSARMDFEFDPLPEGFADRVTELVNAEIAADRPIEVSFLPRGQAVQDEELIRTKVNMIPESVQEIRVIDIVGLDKQADGGTHVRSTAETGTFAITRTESKGKGNKRVRIALT